MYKKSWSFLKLSFIAARNLEPRSKNKENSFRRILSENVQSIFLNLKKKSI